LRGRLLPCVLDSLPSTRSEHNPMIIPIKQSQSRLVEFPTKSLQGKYCLSPFISVTIGGRGEVALCGCSAWHPSIVGNIIDNTLEEILSNHFSQKIRASIADGSYRYCNENTCGVMHQGVLIGRDVLSSDINDLVDNPGNYRMPNEITVALDSTCNLSCPSCRTTVIKSPDHQLQYQRALGKKISSNIFSKHGDEPITVHASTTGELFASPLLLEFVNTIPIDRFANVQLGIQTNGLLAQSRWHRLGAMQNRVKKITVTVDAATKATYEVLRRGGQWEDIVQSLQWISQQSLEHSIEFRIRMVVQAMNFQEMEKFYIMCDKLQASTIEFTRITDWGTYGNRFLEQDVFDPRHVQYDHAMIELSKICYLPKTMISGGLPYRF